MAVIGPGAVEETTVDLPPLLAGVTEFQYVTIFNPLTDDFAIKVAQDIPINAPFEMGKDHSGEESRITNTEHDVRQVYGLNLRNKDFQGRRHITNTTVIPAGKTINLKGNEAQVGVRQLVNEIMQREGNKRLMADPTQRRRYEQMVVKHVGSINDLMTGFQTQQQQINEAINRSNEVVDERPFGGLTEQTVDADAATSDDAGTPDQSPAKRAPGRPKRAG